VIDHAADMNHELTNTTILLKANNLTEYNVSLTIYYAFLPGAKASTNLPKGYA
jgi:hypothetical protein